jgi:hypothetical protein
MGDDHVDAKVDQLRSKHRSSIASPLGITEFQRDALALLVAKIAQALSQSINQWMWWRCRDQHTNARQSLWSLGERPSI